MVMARFLYKVGNTEAGTVRDLPEDHPALRHGYAEKTAATAAVKREAATPDPSTEADPSELKVPELRKLLKDRGQDSTGNRQVLLERLAADPHHHGNEGGEDEGEGVPPEDAVNPDLTDLDGHDEIVTEEHFAGEPNTDDPGIKIASTEDFEGESDPGQDVPDPSPGQDDDF